MRLPQVPAAVNAIAAACAGILTVLYTLQGDWGWAGFSCFVVLINAYAVFCPYDDSEHEK